MSQEVEVDLDVSVVSQLVEFAKSFTPKVSGVVALSFRLTEKDVAENLGEYKTISVDYVRLARFIGYVQAAIFEAYTNWHERSVRVSMLEGFADFVERSNSKLAERVKNVCAESVECITREQKSPQNEILSAQELLEELYQAKEKVEAEQ